MAYIMKCENCGVSGELDQPVAEFPCPQCGGTMYPADAAPAAKPAGGKKLTFGKPSGGAGGKKLVFGKAKAPAKPTATQTMTKTQIAAAAQHAPVAAAPTLPNEMNETRQVVAPAD